MLDIQANAGDRMKMLFDVIKNRHAHIQSTAMQRARNRESNFTYMDLNRRPTGPVCAGEFTPTASVQKRSQTPGNITNFKDLVDF
jgi:hypothetical protein